MRNRFILFVALICLCGSTIAAFATADIRSYELRGYADPIQSTDLPFYHQGLGVNVDLLQYTAQEVAEQLDLMSRAGITWIRQPVYWDKFEPQPGDYRWETFDSIIDIVSHTTTISMVVVFMNSPEWASGSSVPTAIPKDLSDYGQFTGTFARRYHHKLDYYQIWDEPNLYDAWGFTEPNPSQYTALLHTAYTAIKNNDPNATIVSAGLAPTTEERGRNISDFNYLSDLYALGANRYWDIVAGKAYGFDSSHDDRRVEPSVLNFSRIISLRELMTANGEGTKPLWASHLGWNHLSENWEGAPSIWGQVTDSQQIQYTLGALERAEREWPWMGIMFLESWQPDAEPDDPLWGFALIDQEKRPANLYNALAERANNQISAAKTGLHSPLSPYARYAGLWTFNEGLGADIGWLETSDSWLEFDFYGTDIALLVRKGNYVAFIYPTVDDTSPNLLPRDNLGNAYINLRSPSTQPEQTLVHLATNLPQSHHTLRAIADRGWDQWALVGYGVRTQDLTRPYEAQFHVSLVLIILSLATTLSTVFRVNWGPSSRVLDAMVSLLGTGGRIVFGFATSLALLLGLVLTFGDGSNTVFRREIAYSTLSLAITGGLVVLKPGFIITLLAITVLFIVIYRWLLLGLLLTVFWAPFFLFPVELYTYALPVYEMLILITGSATLLRLMADYGHHRLSARRVQWPRIKAIDYVLITWLICGGLAMLWSTRQDVAWTDFRTLFLQPFIFYLTWRVIQPQGVQLRLILYSLLAAGLCVAVIGILLYFQGLAVITAEGGTPRLASVYGSPNNVALLLGRCIPFMLALTLSAQSRLRWGGWACLALMLATVLLTQSVGGILLGVPVGAGCVLIYRLGLRRTGGWVVLGGIAVLAAGFILANISPRFASLLDLSSGTSFFRLRVWESSIEMLLDNPLTGIGLDQFLYYYRSEYIRPDAIWDADLSHPHNFVLDVWLRLGLPGLAIFVVMQVIFWRHVTKYGNSHDPVLVAGTVGAMMATLGHGLIDNSIFLPDLMIVFLVVVLAISAKPQENRTFNLLTDHPNDDVM